MQYEVYTDGSYYNKTNVGGWAYVIMGKDYYFEEAGADHKTTIQRMELKAAVGALQHLEEPSIIKLTSDSRYLVEAFNSGWIDNWVKEDFKVARGDRTNSDLFRLLYELNNFHEITWVHIRGHQGHKWNERCDWLSGRERIRLETKLGLYPYSV